MEKSKSFPQYSSGLGYEDRTGPYSFNGPSIKEEGFGASNDPETKRKKRIASYNMFAKEGKVKASMRESFKWIKTKIDDLRYNL